MCDQYNTVVDFSQQSNLHEILKTPTDQNAWIDYGWSAYWIAIPLILAVLGSIAFPVFCCCYGNLNRSRRDWVSYIVLVSVSVACMIYSMTLPFHLDNPACHLEQSRNTSKELLSELIQPADDVLISFNKTIADVKAVLKQADIDRGGSLVSISNAYTASLDALEAQAKSVDCTDPSVFDCTQKCTLCLNQDPIRKVSDEIKDLPVDDIESNIKSVEDLLLDAQDSVEEGVSGIKDTLGSVIEFIDGDIKEYSNTVTDWSKVADDNTWSLYTPYALVLLSVIVLAVGVLVGSSALSCMGWISLWWFLVLMFVVSFVLLVVSYIGVDVCVVLDQPITQYVDLDNRSMQMVQNCIDDKNVIPDDLVDNYEFTNINFNSTDQEIDYSPLKNASALLYDQVDRADASTNLKSKGDDTKTKEEKFIKAVNITYNSVEEIKRVTKDLLEFGTTTTDFRCTKLMRQYKNMQNSICYVFNTMYLYSLVFFGISLIGIPLVVSMVNLALSLKEYDLLLP